MSKNKVVDAVYPSKKQMRRFRRLYGEEVVVVQVGAFNLVHLDRPDAPTIQCRTNKFRSEEMFQDDCPLCRQMKEIGGDILFDERV